MSDIYSSPFSSYTVINNIPVLLYFRKDGFINPDNYSDSIRNYFSTFLFDDLIVDSISNSKIIGGSPPITYEPIVWYVKKKQVKKYNDQRRGFLPLNNNLFYFYTK